MLDPKGPIALAERDLLFTAAGLMLIVIIPVYHGLLVCLALPRLEPSGTVYAGLGLFGANRCRGVGGARLDRDRGRLAGMERPTSSIPTAAAPGAAPLQVQVVAQDWKFLFIYPEQNIASVNELVFPSDRPLSLALTSDTVMNSFYVPALGGTDLHDGRHGDAAASQRRRARAIQGRNTQYSGAGFSDQNFKALADACREFDSWIAGQAIAAPARCRGLCGARRAKRQGAGRVTIPRSCPASSRRSSPNIAAAGHVQQPRTDSRRGIEMLGRLTFDALPFYSAIAFGGAMVVGGGLAAIALITWFGWWRYLWTEWLTSVDHKRIGIMYVMLALSCCCAASSTPR